MPGTAATRDAFESCSRPSSFDSPSKLPVSGNGPRPSARKSLFPPALPALLLLQVALLLDRPDAATCTKHGFVANHDARAFIGPIGIPYGFLRGGVYNLTVFDFGIDILAKKTDKRKKRTKKKADGEKTDTNNDDNKEDEQDAIDGSNNDDSDEETNKLLDALEGGFLLRRFESESEFAQFEETILEDPTKCSFESFREKQTHEKENADRVLETKGVASSNEAAVTSAADTASGAPAKDGIFLSMQDRTRSWKPNKPSVSHTFAVYEEGLYFLIYQVCPVLQKDDDVESNNSRRNALSLLKKARSTFELDFAYINYDRLGYPSYLTAGEMPLPGMFLYFSISFALCLGVWVGNIRNIQSGKDSTMVGFGTLRNGRDASSSGSASGGIGQRSRGGGGGGGGGGGRPVVHPIHHMMTVLLLLKTLSVFFESVRYHYIRVSGHAELWSVVYYFFAFLKGVFLFTVILLIGSGWSFVKPFLNDREKKVIFLVLLLQVIDNVAVVILTHETMGERRYDNWRAVLHLVDILCCCAVLVPIVWQVNALERNMESRAASSSEGGEVGETSRTLTKLKLFRSFYLLVVAFIYFTRIIVFLVATFLGYKHTWVRYFLTELGTLTFYAVVGFLFRPMAENPYLEVRTDDYDESEDSGGTVRNSERVLEIETVSNVSDK